MSVEPTARFSAMTAALVRETEQWLFDANADVASAPQEVRQWLHEAPREEIRRLRGYVKPNPRNDVAMHEAGRAHSGCPDDCDGCMCPVAAAPCTHCVDHEPAAVCGCPFYQLEDTGKHRPDCEQAIAAGRAS